MITEDVLYKYFRDERMKYFHSSDAHKNIEGDTYLTYRKYGDGRTELYLGGNNGEVCLCVTDNAEKLDSLINLILY